MDILILVGLVLAMFLALAAMFVLLGALLDRHRYGATAITPGQARSHRLVR
jgi:hypothetical protein